jgi:hypothetical protein
MNAHRILIVLAALPLTATTLVGCHGSSPTEMDSPSLAAASSQALDPAAKHGGDDGSDDNGGGGETEPGDDHHQGSGGGTDDGTPSATPTPTPPDHRGPGRHDDRPRGTVEIEGRVSAVGASSLTIGGTIVNVDAATKFSRRGDLTSLQQASAAVAASKRVRAEARAVRQADSSLLAQTIKIEVN